MSEKEFKAFREVLKKQLKPNLYKRIFSATFSKYRTGNTVIGLASAVEPAPRGTIRGYSLAEGTMSSKIIRVATNHGVKQP